MGAFKDVSLIFVLTSDLDFYLPDSLIAQFPSSDHHNDRLLVINRKTGEYKDDMFVSIPDLLPQNSILVLNETKVRNARLYLKTKAGGEVECLFLNPLKEGCWHCLTNRVKRRKVGEELFYTTIGGKTINFCIKEIYEDRTISLEPSDGITEDFFENEGHVPLPPYISRKDSSDDQKLYNTIFAKVPGSVASPTSGLHYTKDVLNGIEERGIKIVKITLNIGLGTFLPVRTQTLEEHKMHTEVYTITPQVADEINSYKSKGFAVIASGTTVVRALESSFKDGKVMPFSNAATSIFITPGYKFNVVDKLITNFHTPGSTLLALVSAFSSLDIVKKAYAHAVREKYRFFSYGDCCYFC